MVSTVGRAVRHPAHIGYVPSTMSLAHRLRTGVKIMKFKTFSFGSASRAGAAAFVLGIVPAGLAQAAPITPAVQFTGGLPLSDSTDYTLGYEFTLSAPVTVDALGYFDDGLSNSHEVAIWNSTGSVLAATTVLGSDPIVDQFVWDSIADVTLVPGTYTIGGEYIGVGDIDVYPTTVTTIPQFTWVTDEQFAGSGLNYPTHSTGGTYGQNGILAVDFSVAGTPEPATWVMTLVGLGGVGLATRSRRRQTV